ncbi:MAG: anthranilate phosphoribosyltransferase [Planctomycetota bacterium]
MTAPVQTLSRDARAAQDALRRVHGGGTLGAQETQRALEAALALEDDAPLAALLAALAQRGERGPEIAGAARALRAAMIRFDAGGSGPTLDTCGTGGDGLGTFNLSTAAALVAAGAGARVVKHGGRAVSSKAGSADVLEALGGRVDVDPAVAREALDAAGFTFLFAPRYHPGMARAARVRRALGIRTVFNLAGPLANPAGAPRQVVGVATERYVEPMARALEELGASAALVVHGAGGADELTLAGAQLARPVGEAAEGAAHAFAAGAGSLRGIAAAPVERLQGGDSGVNAELMRAVLRGTEGPHLDAALVNAAAALTVADTSLGADEALLRAAESVRSGAAARVLEAWIRVTSGGAA